MQSALVRRDAVMLHDPMRTHSRATVVGVILGVLGGVVFVLIALLSPAPTVPDTDNIVIGAQSGTVYVVSGNPVKLTPTFNLASARLILMAQKKAASQGQGQGQAGATPAAAAPAAVKNPTVVSDEQLKNIPRTKLTGIPDGPQLLPDGSQRISPNWAVCDQVELDPQLPQPDSVNKTDTTVVAGVTNVGAELQQGQALHGSAADGKTYLIYRLSASQSRPDANTVRAEVSMNTSDPAHSALQLPSHARKVSQAFLNAITNVEQLAAPTVPGLGSSPSADFGGLSVGDVFSTTPAGQEPEFWLITQTGIQKVSPAVADILRVARNGDSGTIRSLGLDKTKVTRQLQPSDAGYIKV
ncbi:MAG: type VII secretion protein EccB, partial [Acidimicrobiales bacterium]